MEPAYLPHSLLIIPKDGISFRRYVPLVQMIKEDWDEQFLCIDINMPLLNQEILSIISSFTAIQKEILSKIYT